MFNDKLPTMAERYPYAVSDIVEGVFNTNTNHPALDDLQHCTDYIYWRFQIRFKSAEHATMYKLMQNI
jgi:hypothetical protein